MSKFRNIAVRTVKKWQADDGISASAALSFYLVISLPSLLLFSLSLTGMILKTETFQATIIDYLSPFAEQGSIDLFNLIVDRLPATGSLTIGLFSSLILFLWGATNSFLQFQYTVNKIWGVRSYEKNWFRRLFRQRISSFFAVLIFSLTFIISILAEMFLAVISKLISDIFPLSLDLIRYGNSFVNFLLLLGFFIYLYKVLPEKKMEMTHIVQGSFLTVSLITIGKYLFSLYLSYGSFTTAYSTIGTFMVAILWLHYSAIIITLVAEFMQIHSGREQTGHARLTQ
jgi:membrane protein